MTDTIDRPAVLDIDDDVFERPVVTHRPPRPPAPPGPPISATLRYPPGPVPAVEDAPPAPVRTGDPWVWPWQGRLLWGSWLRGSRVRVSPVTAPLVPARPWVWRRSRVLAGLLGVFLGAFGLHRMYLGYWRRGLAMLAITVVGGFFTLGLAALVMVVWGFFEGLLYLSVRRGRFSRDAHGRQLRG